jgi:aerobic-type carbon monoxide dehydrogenase small subunit (CoxS/CutS family)
MPNKDVPDRPDASVEDAKPKRLSRRQFLYAAGAAGATGILAPTILSNTHQTPENTAHAADDNAAPFHYGTVKLTLHINGEDRPVTVEPRTTLLSALRDHLDPPLTGTKLVCDHGNCGACTVDVDGRTVYACMILAVDAAGKKITTIEGLSSSPDKLHPIQDAFIEHDALQCGFCTPGFIMSVRACLAKNSHPTEDDVRHACSGNLCRCGTYPHVFDAALDASRRMHGKEA